MKKISLIIGIIFSFLGLLQGGKYFFYLNELTEYGKGYVLGSFILILLGGLLIYLGLKKKK